MSELLTGPFIVAFGTTTSVLLLFFSAVRWSRWLQSRRETIFKDRFRGSRYPFRFSFFLTLGWTGGRLLLCGDSPLVQSSFSDSVSGMTFSIFLGGRRFSSDRTRPALVHFRGADSLCDESFRRSVVIRPRNRRYRYSSSVWGGCSW